MSLDLTLSHVVSINDLLRAAATLASDGANIEYDRALVDMVLQLSGGTPEYDYDTVADAIVCRIPGYEFKGLEKHNFLEWQTSLRRQVRPVFDNAKTHRFGFEFIENGVVMTNLFFPDWETRAQFYVEDFKPDPNGFFDSIKDFENNMQVQEGQYNYGYRKTTMG